MGERMIKDVREMIRFSIQYTIDNSDVIINRNKINKYFKSKNIKIKWWLGDK